jgi:hypothetical protein
MVVLLSGSISIIHHFIIRIMAGIILIIMIRGILAGMIGIGILRIIAGIIHIIIITIHGITGIQEIMFIITTIIIVIINQDIIVYSMVAEKVLQH